MQSSSPPDREPVFNAPILALALAASMLILFHFQSGRPDEVTLIYRYGLVPAHMMQGDWLPLLTHMLLHGGWAHAGMNAVGALTFGAPVARMMRGLRGLLGFVSFYVTCGLIAGLGYALIYSPSETPMIGASGAVFGLIGAATRMLGRRGRLAPLFDRRVLASAAAWIGANVFIGIIGFAPGAGGARIAWEAHVFGLVAGLILIGPWVRLFGTVPPQEPQEPLPEGAAFDSRPPMSDSGTRSGPWGP